MPEQHRESLTPGACVPRKSRATRLLEGEQRALDELRDDPHPVCGRQLAKEIVAKGRRHIEEVTH